MNTQSDVIDATKALLADLDDPDHLEYPPQFDYLAAQQRFESFISEIQHQTGMAFVKETGVSIQDATFHSQAILPGGILRFSNFGNLIALAPGHQVPSDLMETLQFLAPDFDYRLVQTELLQHKYDGAAAADIRDWWTRFFDWL